VDDIVAAIATAATEDLPIATGGGRHAMGGQQFCEGGLLLDMRPCSRVLSFDTARGLVTVEAGIMWPALVAHLLAAQPPDGQADPAVTRWGIRQKQTGADRLTLGGTISANGHGRGLTYAPIVQDVEELTVVDARGTLRTCSRTQDADLFGLVIGGYGLFESPMASRTATSSTRSTSRPTTSSSGGCSPAIGRSPRSASSRRTRRP
jgi:FAD/FMN-containing dehydrogenase